jgi:mlo protein
LQGHEPFVLYEGLEQLHRFLFILGITHVLYSFVTVVLSMIKVRAHCLIVALTFSLLFSSKFIMVYIFLLLVQIYSWRKWETLAGPIAAEELKGRVIRSSAGSGCFVWPCFMQPC